MPQDLAPEPEPFMEPFTEYELDQRELSIWDDEGGSTRYQFDEYGTPAQEVTEQ